MGNYNVLLSELNNEQKEIISKAISGEADKVAALKDYIKRYEDVSIEGEEYEALEEYILGIKQVMNSIDTRELQELLGNFTYEE